MSEPLDHDDVEQERMHEALLEALAPVELAAERTEAMKRRLLARVEASQSAPAGMPPGLSTVRAGEGEWQSFMPKVRIKVLMREGDTMSYLLRLEPGAMLPPHDHPQTEECVVLEGEVRIGSQVVHPGDYHVARAGHDHGLLRSDSGALLFLRGAVPSARQVRWGSLDAYAPLVPQSMRDKLGRWKGPE
jgi:quercetin dioxygenase-like cupin family protein